MRDSIAVIGAGLAGLTAEFYLKRAGYEVTLFEKSRGVSGRAATRWYDRAGERVYVDHGANYFREEGAALPELLSILPSLTRDIQDISRPVWTFDKDDRITEGDPEQNTARKLTYPNGIAALGKLIVEAGDLHVQSEIRIGRIIHDSASGQFTLFDTDNTDRGTYQQVVVAIPAGQAADLITASTMPNAESLSAALRHASYRRCLSAVLGYERLIQDRPYYALVNTDKTHDVSWIGWEHLKPGHVPTGISVLVVQMAGAYSLNHYEDDKSSTIRDVAQQVSRLLDEDLNNPDFTDLQKWKFSQPDHTIESHTVNGITTGLYFAGDYLRGGRVHLAAESGMEVARLIATS